MTLASAIIVTANMYKGKCARRWPISSFLPWPGLPKIRPPFFVSRNFFGSKQQKNSPLDRHAVKEANSKSSSI
jgi:hypothetical protein